MDVVDNNIVTTPGASEPQGSAMVSGPGVYTGSQVAGSPGSSSGNREGTGVASQAPATLPSTSADAAGADKSSNKPVGLQRREIDIGALSEEALLDLLRGYINSMCAFAGATRNVHKELKETLINSRRTMAQYVKVRQQGRNKDSPTKVQKSACSIDAETQSPCWWDIGGDREPRNQATKTKLMRDGGSGEPTDQQAQTTRWTEVVKKKKKNKVPAKMDDEPHATKPKSEKLKRRGTRTRPAAIVVDVNNQADLPNLVKKIRDGVNPEVIGERVVGMRQTKAGHLLLEIKGDAEEVEAIRKEVAKTTGDGAEVRSLQQRMRIEIRDIDQWTTAEEVADAVSVASGSNHADTRVINIRKGFGASQTALALVPTAIGKKVVEQGRMKIGMVNCRIRQAERKMRCFRCLSSGHMSRECNGPDRSLCCRRCGVTGHQAAKCEATDGTAKEFATHLKKGEKGGDSRLPTVGSPDPTQ